MNIYRSLNEIIEYIEENIEEDIDYKKIAQIMATDEYTAKKVFFLITNVSISEYIRYRRLSNAGYDLCQKEEKIIDLTYKYGYDNPTSFSRAFEKFHGIKPSNVKNNPENLKIFPRLNFDENVNNATCDSNMEYSIIEMDEKILYGKGISTTADTIRKMAPEFFSNMSMIYNEKYGEIEYGMVIYEDRFESSKYEYWIAYEKCIEEFEKIEIPKGKWLKFEINSQEAIDIQNASKEFYRKFLPSSKYKLRPYPELEYYHDNITEFLIPIEE